MTQKLLLTSAILNLCVAEARNKTRGGQIIVHSTKENAKNEKSSKYKKNNCLSLLKKIESGTLKSESLKPDSGISLSTRINNSATVLSDFCVIPWVLNIAASA